jgi:4-hydroxyacetophenone monooxygenase
MAETHVFGNGTKPVDESFIRKAIDKSNLNALRLALLQVTGDPTLAKMRTRRHAIRGGAMFAHVLSEEDAPALKEKAFAYLSKRKLNDPVPPPPSSKADVRKLLDVFGDEPIGDREFNYDYEELAFEEFPRIAKWSSKKPSAEKIANFKIIVIGGGISGLAAAVQFKQLGLNFQVLERQGGIGGTWLLNTYPDARVDTSSYLFQFKFVKNYPWSEFFATAGETRKYLEDVAERYQVKDRFHFNREVVGANWHEEMSEWELTINHDDGHTETLRCNAIVSGSGLFATANEPNIKGIKDFKGPIFHTTKWDHSTEYSDKNVALLGTGSTGSQLAAGVASKAKSLTVYQRTPNWIMNLDGYRATIDDYVRYIFDHMPYYWNWYCYSAHVAAQQLQYLQTYDKEWQAKGGQVNERNDLARQNLTEYIKSKAEGIPGLLEKILPKYPPLVRRLVVDNGFYDMLRRDNVEIITDKIEAFTEEGIKTADGVERKYDIVVLGTGFKVSQYFYPCKYVGRNGRTLEDLWKIDGPRSYLGLVMPGLPNFFSFYGPNHQPRSGGFYSWAEIWSRYTASALIHLIENDKKSIEVRQEVYDDYNTKLDEEAKTLIWEQEGSGYYVNEFGRQSVNVPWHTADYHQMVAKPDFDEFDIR